MSYLIRKPIPIKMDLAERGGDFPSGGAQWEEGLLIICLLKSGPPEKLLLRVKVCRCVGYNVHGRYVCVVERHTPDRMILGAAASCLFS